MPHADSTVCLSGRSYFPFRITRRPKLVPSLIVTMGIKAPGLEGRGSFFLPDHPMPNGPRNSLRACVRIWGGGGREITLQFTTNSMAPDLRWKVPERQAAHRHSSDEASNDLQELWLHTVSTPSLEHCKQGASCSSKVLCLKSPQPALGQRQVAPTRASPAIQREDPGTDCCGKRK